MGSVMVPRLEEVDTIATDKVDDAVFLRQTARPGARREVLQGLWFTDALEGIANDRLDKVKGEERDPSIRFDPVPQVLAELRVKNRFALAPSRWSVPGANGRRRPTAGGGRSRACRCSVGCSVGRSRSGAAGNSRPGDRSPVRA